ncbi:NEDD8-activating enzyme E1 regulatory subunit [Sporormia fimetaria CBS 119925]|uniref:NEDD8-activating enzyme E1 regulatory subunit n=1 Tax=Sporormia fimetaria CBS 119925 TaxID=1340428 RepID=A0A6A6VKT6_9PLEO|nr:NEDD8-activating enzyme E1 regulatory subunit [Sporormia fimetaria CBS 119925]
MATHTHKKRKVEPIQYQMAADLPAPVQGPTAKEKKYDRQLRLWGATGQTALENSHVLLINSGSGAVGVETLKNLILPGIGDFTIQESTVVTEEHLGVNFFLEEEDVGRYRAERTCALLNELNPDVRGHAITEPIETFLSSPDALKPYTLILVTAPIRPEHLSKIAAHAASALVPLFYIHSVGYYSHFSLQLPPVYPIVDTHPSPESTTDLRLLRPWPELLQFAEAQTQGLESMAADDHGHIPYIAIILHFLEVWKKEHDGQAPRNYKEKSAFRDMVSAAARRDTPEGGEENFDEAVAAVLKSLNPPEPSSAVKELFKEPECKDVKRESASFWIIANAVAHFYAKHGVIPVPGSVPDMKARSADYIELQNIYKMKARNDVAKVLQSVRDLEQSLQRETKIEEKDVEAFCKNAAHIRLVRGRPIHVVQAGQTIQWGDRAKALAQSVTFEDSLLPLHIAFLAYDSFTSSHGNDGFAWSTDPKSDNQEMSVIANKILDDLIQEAGITVEEEEDSSVKRTLGFHVHELCRAGGGELINIASLTAGLVSQEAIKVITEQYIPVDNTCLFDGVRSKTEVVRV